MYRNPSLLAGGRPASPHRPQRAPALGSGASPPAGLPPHQAARAGGPHPESWARSPSSGRGGTAGREGAPRLTEVPGAARARRWRAAVTH